MARVGPSGGYGSAEDLPTIREMRSNIRALKVFKGLLPKEKRGQIAELEENLDRTTRIVDAFYQKLGPRNWIYDDQLPQGQLETLVELDVDEAETALIELYQSSSTLDRRISGLTARPEFAIRRRLLDLALDDYRAQRFHSVVLTLIPVMDGFVNDFEPARRKGLHARDSDEMNPWDSVVGHHMGLAHVHREVFTRTLKRTDEQEVRDVYRHGILHGNLTNFANVFVATKCWNMLFALDGWASAVEKAEKPEDPPATWGGVLRKIDETRRRKEKQDAWVSHDHTISPEDDDELVQTVRGLLDNWANGRWALVGEALLSLSPSQPSTSERVEVAKSLFSPYSLDGWTLHRRRHVASAVALVDAELVVGGAPYSVELRWIRVANDNSPAAEWEPGRWVLTMYWTSEWFS